MDYYKPVRDQMVQQEMYPTEHRRDFFPKGAVNDSLRLGPKPPCQPRFVSRIEGNAVEEGARVFFEGIVDSQPQPQFTWYFDDEEIFPGEAGFEEMEIHHSRKMSTLIIKYAREHHMGKYSLAAQNRLGGDICHCDLIVRKKQFPPVFWKRLPAEMAFGSGHRVVAEVEVGGWPLPDVEWFKDGERILTQKHTENYNGFPNRYVPERLVEVRRVDEIRHCLVITSLSESDEGTYVCRAVNPLGEAVCEAEMVVDYSLGTAGGDGGDRLYLPEKWRTGKRLTWKDEDARLKPFANLTRKDWADDDALTAEDIAKMAKGMASTPLPRVLEYLAGLPNYVPKPMSSFGLLPMGFTPDSALKNVKPRIGQRGGQASKPSKFIAGDMDHRGYACDDFGRILPIWKNPHDKSDWDPWSLLYRAIGVDCPARRAVVRQRPERARTPDAVPVWESQAALDALRRMLDQVGTRAKPDLGSIRSDQLGNASQARRQNQQQQGSHLKEQTKARKNLMQNVKSDNSATKHWKERLNADVTGAKGNAGDFTKSFMQEMYTSSTSSTTMASAALSAPALPPKTKIMFSPSRHVFSPPPSDEQQQHQPEFIPVKEKARMIEQQQEEIERREQIMMEESSSSTTSEWSKAVKGGVRILPPSPVTVAREKSSSQSPVPRPKREQQQLPQSPLTVVSHDEGDKIHGGEAEESTTGYSYSRIESSEVSSMMSSNEQPNYIPVLEDKYNVNENLDELGVVNVTFRTQQHQQQLPQHVHQQQQQQQVRPQVRFAQEPQIQQQSGSRVSQSSYCYVVSSTQQGGGGTASTVSSSSSSSLTSSGRSGVLQQHQSYSPLTISSGRGAIQQQQHSYSPLTLSSGRGVSQQQQQQTSSSPLTLSPEKDAIEYHQQQQQVVSSSSATFSRPSIEEIEDDAAAAEQFEVLAKDVLREQDTTVEKEDAEQRQQSIMMQQEGKAQEPSSHNGHDISHSSRVFKTQTAVAAAVSSASSNNASPAFGPLVSRQPNQSPMKEEEERIRYRTPPMAPFQPAFYKTPSDDQQTRVKNESYKLPSQIKQKTTSTDRRMRAGEEEEEGEEIYDGDNEF